MVSSCRNHYLRLHLYGIESIRRNTAAIFENSFLRAAWFCLNKANFNTLILGFFSTKQLLAAKTPIFGAFSKQMIFSTLTSIWRKTKFDNEKSQRRRKIWRWLLKIWRAYKNAKSGKIEAKNQHKTTDLCKNWAFEALATLVQKSEITTFYYTFSPKSLPATTLSYLEF